MTSEVNAELLCAVLTFLVAHPEKHDQNHWLRRRDAACETVGCVAGWTRLMSGYEEVWDTRYPELLLGVRRAGDPEGSYRDVQAVATELLGLETQDAYRLFDDENSMNTLWQIANELTDGEVSQILTGDESESA